MAEIRGVHVVRSKPTATSGSRFYAAVIRSAAQTDCQARQNTPHATPYETRMLSMNIKVALWRYDYIFFIIVVFALQLIFIVDFLLR